MATLKQSIFTLALLLTAVVSRTPHVHSHLAFHAAEERNFAPPPPCLPNSGPHIMVPVAQRGIFRREEFITTLSPTFATLYEVAPSPGAWPIPITEQSQLITSYVPVTTICPLAPAYSPTMIVPSAATNDTLANITARNTAAAITTYPSSLLTMLRNRDTTSCSTSYSSTVTPICHTNLSPLGAPPIPITACSQYVGFSSEYGYTLVPSSGTGLYSAQNPIQTMTTSNLAPWEALSAGVVPSGTVERVVCSAGACETGWGIWGPAGTE